MHEEFLMGNEAMALGALAAGVRVVAGYPGTPSTEVLDTIARRNPGNVYVEWSVNEKAGMEVAAGAAWSGARSLVTMKQVGLNVASDPLMSLAYLGVKAGMVVLVADDPGPISSQTEQDTRTFARYSKLPCFDPSSVADAYHMIQDAFEFSERHHTPVLMRPTTRIDHGYEAIQVADPEQWRDCQPDGFQKDPSRWVIFPKLSRRNHELIEKRNLDLRDQLSAYAGNQVLPAGDACTTPRLGIATHGVSYTYVLDVLGRMMPADQRPRLLRVATPFPFPDQMAEGFLDGLDQVLCVEELDPVIERSLLELAGAKGIDVRVRGKLTGDAPMAGENTLEGVEAMLRTFLGSLEQAQEAGSEGQKDDANRKPKSSAPEPQLPVRPPVLCAGCPHRASFYAVKVAMKGRKTIYCGDIGCYTLGNAHPLDMCDTCLCMGAGINIAQGVYHVDLDTACFAFVGDSTFFASGITGVVNAYYNQANLTLVVLDNSTTAMTGHQPHPGTGRTAMGQQVKPVDITAVLRGIGLTEVRTVDPLDQEAAVRCVREVVDQPGVKAIIFKSPCVVLAKPQAHSQVDRDRCISCGRCISQLGCPGLYWKDGKAAIDQTQCTGCTLCEQVCPAGAISGGERL